MAALERPEWRSSAGTEISAEGQTTRGVYVLKYGWAIRYKSLENGTRLIIDFILPGEFGSLGAMMFERADESISTITTALWTMITPEQMAEMFRRFPRLAMALVWQNVRKEASLTERLLNVARRPAQQSIAHLLVELWHRQKISDRVEPGRSVLPITQAHVADCLGLSSVHVNRMLRQFRENGLVAVRRREVLITDLPGLVAIAGFDDRYLRWGDVHKRLASAEWSR